MRVTPWNQVRKDAVLRYTVKKSNDFNGLLTACEAYHYFMGLSIPRADRTREARPDPRGPTGPARPDRTREGRPDPQGPTGPAKADRAREGRPGPLAQSAL